MTYYESNNMLKYIFLHHYGGIFLSDYTHFSHCVNRKSVSIRYGWIGGTNDVQITSPKAYSPLVKLLSLKYTHGKNKGG